MYIWLILTVMMMVNEWLMKKSGWWLSHRPLWKIRELKSVGMIFSIPNWMESHSEFHGSSHHQPVGMMGLWWEDGIMMIIVG